VAVSIGTGVFVPKADHVAQLVDHNAKFVAVFADRNGLHAVSSPSHERAAPAHENKQTNMSLLTFHADLKTAETIENVKKGLFARFLCLIFF